MLEFIVKESIALPQNPAAVWDALTNPHLIKEYFFGTEVTSGWAVGSKILFRGEWEGKAYEDHGTILALEENHYLKYDYWSSFSGKPDVPANYARVTYSLIAEGKGTILVVTQDNCATAEARDHSAANWRTVLNNLSGVLKSRKSINV